MKRSCFYHVGCPDGFGAVWAVWRAWGDDARYIPRGHSDPLPARDVEGREAVFVDIAPAPATLRPLVSMAGRIVILDHHVSSRDRYAADDDLARALADDRHSVLFDLGHSGAVLAWHHFHPGVEPPDLLRYVEDQDLWNWKLPRSDEVNAAIGSTAYEFAAWDEMASRSIESLADEGAPIVRAHRIEIERSLQFAHPVTIGGLRAEAVNAPHRRSSIGHELALRAAFGAALGVVYRVSRNRVDVSLYSIGEVDVSRIASGYGGGGHRNAAGFSLPLADWIERFL